jgi:hypothetical protein
MDADVFAREALSAIAAGEFIIILPRWWKALWYLERASPALSLRLWDAMMGKLRRDLESAGARPR